MAGGPLCIGVGGKRGGRGEGASAPGPHLGAGVAEGDFGPQYAFPLCTQTARLGLAGILTQHPASHGSPS